MSTIRPLEPDDCDAVAELFQKMLREGQTTQSAELSSYMRDLYLDSPGCDPEITPLVHLNAEGSLSGFIGVNALPMTFRGQPIRAAICGTLMVEARESDPMAGARLMRAFLSGPQDLSFSETANEVAGKMWTRLRGTVLPQYSLEWVRIIRPAGFCLAVAANRFRALRLLGPLASGADVVARRRFKQNGRDWAGVVADIAPPEGFTVSPVDKEGFADLMDPLTAHFEVRPDWAEGQLQDFIADAIDKPDYGEPVMAAVNGRDGSPVGAFFYHLHRNGLARVLQVLSHPRHTGPVVDCLIADATARGAIGLRGRTQPALLEAMLPRRIVFLRSSSTVVHSRNSELVQAFQMSDGFLNGLAGEEWSKLFGGRF